MAKPIGADIPRKSRTPREIFGLAITELRVKRGENQGDVAHAVGCKEGFLGCIERGTRNFSFELEYALVDYFQMLPLSKFWAFAEKLAKVRRNQTPSK